jgi:hypothetical protein
MGGLTLASIDPHLSGRGRTIVLIHGRSFKPSRDVLLELWIDAIRCGLQRDFPDQPGVFDASTKALAYFGDATTRLLTESGKSYDERLDIADRRHAFAALAGLEQKKFKRTQYERLPGKTPVKEFLVDLGAPLVSTIGLTDWVVTRAIPELAAYWRHGSAYRTAVDLSVVEAITGAMLRGDQLIVISHCIGSISAFNALWLLSRGGHADNRFKDNKVDTWITLGSPLGDETVKRKLLGGDAERSQRYPNNVVNWYNFAAEDDYTCHDETVANDFKAMLDQHVISRIVDQRIYNLAVRYGRSNPHSAVGYLTHPRVIKVIAEAIGGAQ